MRHSTLERSSMLPTLAAAVVALGAACAEPADDDDASAAESVAMLLENRADVAVELLHQSVCEDSSGARTQVPLPPEGVPAGEDFTWDLGGEGCWRAEAEGGGCFVSVETGPLPLGGAFTWTLGPEDLLCVGG